jgi:hypothetical protein
MANQKIVPLDQVDPQSSPYFSLIIVPGKMAGLNMHRRPSSSSARAAWPPRSVSSRLSQATIHGLAGACRGRRPSYARSAIPCAGCTGRTRRSLRCARPVS